MLILNFSHPLTEAQLEQARSLLDGVDALDVINIPVQFDPQCAFAPQIEAVLAQIELSGEELQTLPLLINLPSHNVIAAILLARLHGLLGYFPTVLRLRAIPEKTPPQFEIAEVVNLQSLRDQGRLARYNR
ncbi:MAG: CRISPR-associated protein Csx15 [Anaerolineaceae bacterium]|jgi:hypothetical protein